ncbi:unnamed protein product, partial [Bubo scandiacus]
ASHSLPCGVTSTGNTIGPSSLNCPRIIASRSHQCAGLPLPPAPPSAPLPFEPTMAVARLPLFPPDHPPSSSVMKKGVNRKRG